MKRLTWLVVLAGSLGALGVLACSSLPEPHAADVAWASQRWPDTSLERLKAGRVLYASKCSGCHMLKSPDAVSPEQWAHEVADMQAKMAGQLSDTEAELILRYLTTASARRNEFSARTVGVQSAAGKP